jgi:glutathione S-transferase
LPALYPQAPAEKARCRLLELFADEILLPPLRSLMHRSEPPEPARRDAQEAEAAKGEARLRELHTELERQLGTQDWFCGAFSVADIGLLMSCFWAERLKGPAPEGALGAWYQRCLARPSIAKVVDELRRADRQLSPALYS